MIVPIFIVHYPANIACNHHKYDTETWAKSQREKVSSVLNSWQRLTDSRGCERRAFHMHQLGFSSSTRHLDFQKHCLFTASWSTIKVDFPKTWVTSKSPNKPRRTGRKQPLTVSGLNKPVIVIIMGFSISTFLISGCRNLCPANQKSVCGVRSGGKTTFTTLKRLERFFHTMCSNSNVLAKPEKGQIETAALTINRKVWNVEWKRKISSDYSHNGKM